MSTASAQGKIFNSKNSFKQYLCLLLDRSSAALASWTAVSIIAACANVTLNRSRLPKPTRCHKGLEDVTRYETQMSFSHAVMSGGYYQCMREAFACRPSDVAERQVLRQGSSRGR